MAARFDWGTASLRVPLPCLLHHNPQRIAPIRWNRTFLTCVNLLKRGPTSGGMPMAPISASEAFLTVAIMSVTFLIEVGFFALIGLF
jgi:hypothetical protein